jgi:hypothetical protein
MFGATPSIGFPLFKTIGKTVTDFTVAEASERCGPAGSFAHAGTTTQHAAAASATWENRLGLIASLLEKSVAAREKSPFAFDKGSLRRRI